MALFRLRADIEIKGQGSKEDPYELESTWVGVSCLTLVLHNAAHIRFNFTTYLARRGTDGKWIVGFVEGNDTGFQDQLAEILNTEVVSLPRSCFQQLSRQEK